MAIVGFVLGGTVLRRLFLPLVGDGGGEIVDVMGGQLTITPGTVLLLVVSALLMAGVIAALLLSVTLFARSFKEAQTYVAPLSFLLIVPAIALQFRDLLGAGDAVYWIPVYNVMLLMDDVVKGARTPADPRHLGRHGGRGRAAALLRARVVPARGRALPLLTPPGSGRQRSPVVDCR
jgi:sodium transport system permease protein